MSNTPVIDPPSTSLKNLVDSYAESALNQNPLLQRAREGRLPKRVIAHYLKGLQELLAATNRSIKLAQKSATELGETALADILSRKCLEEAGHDEWAKRDLEALCSAFDIPVPSSDSPAIASAVAFQNRLATDDPCSYLAYIFAAEYSTVALGPTWVEVLVERCGIPAACLTVVTKHVDLDVVHASSDLAEIDMVIKTEEQRERLVDALAGSLRTIEQFYAELDALARSPEANTGIAVH